MLSTEVYEEIAYQASRCNSDNLIVDCGTAGGASCCAALKGSEKYKPLLITFDKFEGGSREKFGSKEENIQLAKINISKFDKFKRAIIKDVTFSRNFNLENYIPKKVNLLILDMDGQIDRDIINFSKFLSTNNTVIIDDYTPEIRVIRKNLIGDIKIDSKQYLTYNLCNYFEKINLLSIFKVIDNTVFGKLNIDNFKLIEPDKLLDIYSEFIYCESNLGQTNILRFLKNRIKFLKNQFNRNILS